MAKSKNLKSPKKTEAAPVTNRESSRSPSTEPEVAIEQSWKKSTGSNKFAPDDDFVLTISDSDENVPDLEDEEEVDSESEVVKSPSPEPDTRGKKRKCTEKPAEKPRADPNKDAGGLDPNFEFQIGELGGVTGEYEGWGFEGARAAMKDQKKGVDIDEIIRRRKAKRKAEDGDGESDGSDGSEGEDVDSEDIEDDEDEEGEEDGEEAKSENGEEGSMEFTGFANDDEDVADDAFGMGADLEEDEEGDKAKDSNSDGSNSDDEGDDSDAVSNVKEEVAHPMDEESGSEPEGEKDAEEAAKKAAFFAPEEGNVQESDPTISFQNMNLSRPILRGLANVGFTTPTLIQQKTIPVALLGKDVVGGAQTGSGKTAAFVVPILERLLYRPKKVATSRVLILCPTRELAMQAHSVAVKLAAYTDIKFTLAVGGLSLKIQEAELKQRPDVIIATPGRFIDHMRNSQGFTVDTIEIIVMDEADRMLEDGFADELNEIISTIPKPRQTMLFSATMTDSVGKLIRLSLQRPVRLMVDAKKSTVKTLVQEFIRIRPQRDKYRLAMLVHLCKDMIANRCIVFFRSKVFAHKVRVIFGLFGICADELHGSLTQEQRVKAVESFRDGKTDFLLATDLASRGLDIKGVDVVINYEAPQSHEIYLHRVGRTARAGRQGRAITLAAESDRKVVKSAVKMAQADGAKVISRVLDNDKVNAVHAKLEALSDEVEAVMDEEKQEREIAAMEMQVRRTENIAKHGDEIAARPRRTWFKTQREKQVAEKISKAELNGIVLPTKKEKLSGKKRKREESREETGYKKTKNDRIAIGSAAGSRGGLKMTKKMQAKRAQQKRMEKAKPMSKRRKR